MSADVRVRIPDELHVRLREYCSKTLLTPSIVIRQALVRRLEEAK